MPPYSARTRLVGNLAGVALFVVAAAWCASPQTPEPEKDRSESAVDREIASPAGGALRDGIAAVVLMDVSGSMAEGVRTADGKEPKIDVARRAALVLVRQFEAYAAAHPDEPVLVGLYEFSERDDQPHSREIIPLSRADAARAEGALAAMRPGGGTPIGSAMIADKRALDRAGLASRHLLVVTDGENTDGPGPSDVMQAIGRRPESERPSVYFVAFDIDRSRFNGVRDAGGLVLAASDAGELNATLSSLLTGKILVEGP